MEYRFADGSLFPFQVNFIEMLRDSIDCTVELLAIQDRVDAIRSRIIDAEHLLRTDIETLVSLEEAVRGALGRVDGAAELVVARIAQSTGSIVSGERATLAAKLEVDRATALGDFDAERGRMLTVMDRLVRKHDLPGTEFGVNLELPSGAHAYWGHVSFRTPIGLHLTLSLNVPAGHRFAQPLRVRDLVGPTDIAVEAPNGPVNRGSRLTSICLDKYFLTELRFDADGGTLRLRQKPVTASVGFDLLLTCGDLLSIHVCHIRPDGSEGQEAAQKLSDKDTSKIEALVMQMRMMALDLARGSGTLEQAVMEEATLTEQESPGEIARRLTTLLAPLTTEISRRGSMGNELSLKRDLGGGRREEIYVSKEELYERVSSLPENLRAVFHPLELRPGLGQPLLAGAAPLMPDKGEGSAPRIQLVRPAPPKRKSQDPQSADAPA